MKKPFSLILLSFGAAFASGTVTQPANSGAKCATSSIEGPISALDVRQETLSVAGRSFKVGGDTSFRIPGSTRLELQAAPLSKVPKDAKVKVLYCTKDGTPVEVKVER
jgi:hypothetical protein